MPPKASKKTTPKLDALPDTLDFRDRMFDPTLIEVPTNIPLADYQQWKIPILDQGQEGACTGFGLATVANYLLTRRKVIPDPSPVSPRMFYEIAKRYDEWPGENYEGSSARGAMKGWHKHGVCAESVWPYSAKKTAGDLLTSSRAEEAKRRPLGSYFRVNHRDLVAMHSAISEVGILYATAMVHSGWADLGKDGLIKQSSQKLGGHAFAIVAYGANGFWIQNSWGTTWGKDGFGQVTYDDWLENGTDIWVARLGAPVKLITADASATGYTAAARDSRSYVFCDLRPHIISVGNDGELRTDGTYGTSAEDVRTIVEQDFPALTEKWKTRRLLLYAHGGLVAEDAAIQRIADYRAAFLDSEVYPLSFIWKTDYWSTIKNILSDALQRRRPEGFLDKSKDFMLDRLDDALEPLARALSGKLEWDEMKENALLASSSASGATRTAANHIAALLEHDPSIEVHLACHSAGSIFHAGLVRQLTEKAPAGHGLTIESCTLWAPACTVDLFKQSYLPALNSKNIKRFAMFTLTDDAERNDNCAEIYHKSLLYLVSNAFEMRSRIPLVREGEPILGMEKFVRPALLPIFSQPGAEWVRCPNNEVEGSNKASRARSHGDFDDDTCTVKATLSRILNVKEAGKAAVRFHRTASSQLDRRNRLMSQTR